MKINKLTIEGFRSLKKVHWEPNHLNLIIGPNGAGKSNLLRFLELMTISAQAHLGKYVQSLGGMEPLVWDGQSTRIGCQLKMSDENRLLLYELELARLGHSSAYRIEQERLADDNLLLDRNHFSSKIWTETDNTLKTLVEPIPEEESLLSMAASPFTVNHRIADFQRQMASWLIYHDVSVDRNALIRQPVVTRTEKQVAADGQNLISVLHTLYTSDRDFRYDINAAMRAAFGNEFEELMFPPAADQRTQLRVLWKSLQRGQSAAELSDGTLRFLFLLTVLASHTSFAAIDEPELGLHPSMLPIVAEYAVAAAEQAQILLTTHSPQFLDAFTNTEARISVAVCEQGETKLKNLEGEVLAYWLEQYSLGHLFSTGELEDLA